MFTGIITDVGRVRAVKRQGDTRFTIETAFDTETIAIGASIAHNGVCLTVIEKGPGTYVIQASGETLSKTTSTATLARAFCSESGMPRRSNVRLSSGSTSSMLASCGLVFGAE